MNFITKPSKKNLGPNLSLGISLIILSFLDVTLNAFLSFNLIGFLPNYLGYFFPLPNLKKLSRLAM